MQPLSQQKAKTLFSSKKPNFVANKPKHILVAMKVKAAYFATKSRIAVFCELRLAAFTVVAKNPKHVFGKIKVNSAVYERKKVKAVPPNMNPENRVTYPKINGNVCFE